MTESQPFTCPVCGRTSHNPMDYRYGYCGNCHAFTGEEHLPAGEGFVTLGGVRDHFVAGMFFGPEGEPLTTLQWAHLYQERMKNMDADAWWRAGLDVIDDVLEVSTVWTGNNLEVFGPPNGMWQLLCFWLGDGGREPIGETETRYPDRATATAGHQELVGEIRKIGVTRFRAVLDAISDPELSPDAAVWVADEERKD